MKQISRDYGLYIDRAVLLGKTHLAIPQRDGTFVQGPPYFDLRHEAFTGNLIARNGWETVAVVTDISAIYCRH